MKWVGGLILSAVIWGQLPESQAQTITATVKPVGNVKSQYSISSDATTVTTTAAGSTVLDKEIEGFMFPTLRRALEGSAFIGSIVQTKGAEVKETNKWWDYELFKRKTNAFVTFTLQSPITLLFEIEESFRRCIPGKEVASDESGYSSSCSKQAVVTIKGPISIYGNYATAINADALLRNKQELELTFSRSYDKKDAVVATRFNVKSVSFDESLSRFFSVFNIPIFTSQNDVSVGNGLLDKISPLTSRQKLMLGIARIARQANERMLIQ